MSSAMMLLLWGGRPCPHDVLLCDIWFEFLLFVTYQIRQNESFLQAQSLWNSLRWLSTWWPTWRCNSWRGKIRLRTRQRGNGERRSDNRGFLGYWRLRILLWPRKIFKFELNLGSTFSFIFRFQREFARFLESPDYENDDTECFLRIWRRNISWTVILKSKHIFLNALFSSFCTKGGFWQRQAKLMKVHFLLWPFQVIFGHFWA